MTGDVFAAAVAAATAGGGGPRALRREGPFSEEAGLAFRWIAAFMVKVLLFAFAVACGLGIVGGVRVSERLLVFGAIIAGRESIFTREDLGLLYF